MSLRSKLTILSFTLMSLMTIPTLAENDAPSIHSRIEDAQYDVQIKTPEGWTETKDFDLDIPETLEVDGMIYRGLTFKGSDERQGCAVFFAAAVPEAKTSSLSLSKKNISWASEANALADPKSNFKGAFKVSYSENSFLFFINGLVSEDYNFPGTITAFSTDDYGLIIYCWGPDENAQQMEALRFLKAMTIQAKAPTEPAETVQVVASDAIIIEETVTTTAPEAVVALETNLIVEAAPAVVEEAATTTDANPVVEVAIVEEAVSAAPEAAPVSTETAV